MLPLTSHLKLYHLTSFRQEIVMRKLVTVDSHPWPLNPNFSMSHFDKNLDVCYITYSGIVFVHNILQHSHASLGLTVQQRNMKLFAL